MGRGIRRCRSMNIAAMIAKLTAASGSAASPRPPLPLRCATHVGASTCSVLSPALPSPAPAHSRPSGPQLLLPAWRTGLIHDLSPKPCTRPPTGATWAAIFGKFRRVWTKGSKQPLSRRRSASASGKPHKVISCRHRPVPGKPKVSGRQGGATILSSLRLIVARIQWRWYGNTPQEGLR